MGLKVFIKGLGDVNFPDGMTPDQVQAAVRQGMRDGSLELAADLPMDPASKRARAELWGGNEDYYHGSTHDITEFDGSRANAEGDWGKGTYATNTAEDAAENYAGEGPDLTNRLERMAEEIDNSWSWDDDIAQQMEEALGKPLMDASGDERMAVATDMAREHLKGDAGAGVMYPLKINTDNYARVGRDPTYLEQPDYHQQAIDEGDINRADFDDEWEYDDAIQERAYELADMDEEGNLLARVNEALRDTDAYQNEEGIATVIDQLQDSMDEGRLSMTDLDQAIRENLYDNYDDMGDLVSPGGISAQVMQNLGYEGVIDQQVPGKFSNMEGVWPDTEHVVTFPGNEHRVRSKFANFDPAGARSKDIMKALAPVMVSLGLASNTEEAEAGGFSAAMRATAGALATPQRLVELGYIKPHMANDPKQVQRGANRFIKNSSNNPAFLKREIMHDSSPLSIKARNNMAPPIYRGAEEMVGKTGVPVVGDRSRTDVNIHLPEMAAGDHIRAEGGANYPLEHMGTGDAWASMAAAAANKQRGFDLAHDITGENVLGVYSAMGPEAINFSTPIAEYLLKATQQGKTTKAARRAMDKAMRNPTKGNRKMWPGVDNDPKHPDKAKRGWVGIDHPEALDQLMGRNGYPNIGNRRTAMTKVFGSKGAEELGFPVWGDIVRAATEPELGLDPADTGMAGFSMFDAKPGEKTHAASKHQTYDTAIPGEYFGGLEQQLPPEVMWPQTWADLSVLTNKKGKPLTRSQKTGSFMMNPSLHERFDDRWLEGVQRYQATGELPAYKGRPDQIALQKQQYQELQRGNADPALLGGIGALGVGGAAALAPEDAEAGISAPAKALGYTKQLYHGTGAPDLTDVDMDMVDLGLHMGTPQQASKRLERVAEDRDYNGQDALEAPNILPLNYRQGKTLAMEDVGRWENSQVVLDALRSSDDPELKAWADEQVPWIQSDATGWEDTADWIDSPENRSWLDETNAKLQELGYDTIEYQNMVENDLGSRASLSNEDHQLQTQLWQQKRDIYDRALARQPDPRKDALDAVMADPNVTEEMVQQVMDETPWVDRTPEYTPEESAQLAEIQAGMDEIDTRQNEASKSYIALDPANIRSEYAEFNPENEGIPGLMGGLGAAGVLGASALGGEQAQASPFNEENLGPIQIGQPEVTPETERADAVNARLREMPPELQENSRSFMDDLQGAGVAANAMSRGMGGMALGGLKALWDLAGGAEFDDAIGSIDEMTALAFEGFEPSPEMMQNMQSLMEQTREAADFVFGEDLTDLYMTGFEQAGDAAAERFNKWGYPRVGAGVGAAIRAGEMLSPI